MITSCSMTNNKKNKYFWNGLSWSDSNKSNVKIYRSLAHALRQKAIAIKQTNYILENLNWVDDTFLTKKTLMWKVKDIDVEAFELVSLGIQDESNFCEEESTT